MLETSIELILFSNYKIKPNVHDNTYSVVFAAIKGKISVNYPVINLKGRKHKLYP